MKQGWKGLFFPGLENQFALPSGEELVEMDQNNAKMVWHSMI
jgi:hypothetical protein